jgi:hypothetical protein
MANTPLSEEKSAGRNGISLRWRICTNWRSARAGSIFLEARFTHGRGPLIAGQSVWSVSHCVPTVILGVVGWALESTGDAE